MKKNLLKSFLFVCLFNVIIITVIQSASAEVQITQDEDGNNYYKEIIDAAHYTPSTGEGRIFKGNKNDIFIYQLFDRVNFLEAGYEVIISKYGNSSITKRIPLRLDSFYFDDNNLVIWGRRKVNFLHQYEIYKYDSNLNLINSLVLNDVGYASFHSMLCIDNQYFFAGGASGNSPAFLSYNQGKDLAQTDAVIMILGSDLSMSDVWIYGGNNHERFTAINYIGGNFLLTGEKSSIGSGDFSNIGQENQEKVFVTKIDQSGQIINTMYFDHGGTYEYSFSSIILDAYIYVSVYIEDTEENYIYKVNSQSFTIEWGIEISDSAQQYLSLSKLVKASESSVVIVGSDINGKLALHAISALDGDFLGYTGVDISFHLSFAEIRNGVLRLVGDNIEVVNNKTEYFAKVITLEQYKVEKNIEKVCSRILCNLDKNDNVEVSSWFGSVTFLGRTLPSEFSQNIHGTYEMDYLYALPSNRQITIESSLSVVFYSNIIEDGVYGLGFKVHFTGTGTLNGNSFISGRGINTPGNYQLVTKDNLGIDTIINFTIEDGIIYSGDNNTVWNIECEKNELLEVKIHINNPDSLEILNVIINQTSYDNFILSEDYQTISIEIIAPAVSGLALYLIDKVEYDYHGEVRSLLIDSLAIINVLKTTPSIVLVEEASTNKSINLKAEFVDIDQAIINLKVVLFENDNPIRSKEINLINGEFNFEKLRTNTSYKAVLVVTYNLGNNVRSTVEIVEVSFFTLKENITLGSVTITKKGISLEEAIIYFSRNSTNLVLSSVKIGGKELISSSEPKDDNTLYYLVGGGSIAVMTSTIYLVSLKKKKNQI